MPDITIRKIFPNGFGFGSTAETAISAAAREALPGNDDLVTLIDDTIEHDQRLLVPIDLDKQTGRPLDDDGCGDGRAVDVEAGAVYGNGRTFTRSLHRAKVMGGGATMAAAARIGLGLAAAEDLGATFLSASLGLQERSIGFGGHTDTGGNDVKSGCGAIDRSVEILQAVSTHRSNIIRAISSLGFATESLEQRGSDSGILDNFAADAAQEAYNGRQVSDSLVRSNQSAVFKRLSGQHQETRIILNAVPDYTVRHQDIIRSVTADRAQTFAVDVWRLQRLANGLYEQSEDRHDALLAMLTYTMATAAVLTKGDLPVYLIAPAA